MLIFHAQISAHIGVIIHTHTDAITTHSYTGICHIYPPTQVSITTHTHIHICGYLSHTQTCRYLNIILANMLLDNRLSTLYA